MTYEEALKWILANHFDGDNSAKYCVDGCEEVMAMKRATEALEKQIPKKPVYKDELFLGKPCKAPYCPTCDDSWNGDEYGECMKYCWNCGQTIDWSDT